jgi:hypothetical protein
MTKDFTYEFDYPKPDGWIHMLINQRAEVVSIPRVHFMRIKFKQDYKYNIKGCFYYHQN